MKMIPVKKLLTCYLNLLTILIQIIIFHFQKRKKETNLTEYYNFMYQYKNDCLAASVEYNKSYYNDRDIKPEESIFFKLTIMPFGQIASTPDLMK